MSHMTKLPGVPDRDDVIVGMAHYAGSGPLGKTCGDCANRTPWPEHGDCAVYRRLAGRIGRTLTKRWAACRYFEEKEQQCLPNKRRKSAPGSSPKTAD